MYIYIYISGGGPKMLYAKWYWGRKPISWANSRKPEPNVWPTTMFESSLKVWIRCVF